MFEVGLWSAVIKSRNILTTLISLLAVLRRNARDQTEVSTITLMLPVAAVYSHILLHSQYCQIILLFVVASDVGSIHIKQSQSML